MAAGCPGGRPVTQSVAVRPGTENDLRAVALLWLKLSKYHESIGMHFPVDDSAMDKWVDSFSRTLGRFSFLWVVESGGEIGGFLLARIKKTPAYLGSVMVGEISDLFVGEVMRGQGTGRQLVAEAMKLFKEQKVHSVEVQIMAQNTSGLAFWNALGFDNDIVLVRQMIKPDGPDA
jgi:L-amino acid N-acyltransferase YncA